MTILTTGALRRAIPPIPASPWVAGGQPTTLAAEATYLRQLAAQRNVGLAKIATSVQGRDIYAIRIGTGGGTPAMIHSGTHLDIEYAGREAALIMAREIITSTDAAVREFVAERSIWILPTFSPDGFVNKTRNNANGINLNRDMLAVTQPETRGLAAFLRDNPPLALYDAHEHLPGADVSSVEYMTGMNPAMNPGIHSYGITAAQRSYIAELTAYPTQNAWYSLPSSSPNMVAELAALHGAHTTLVETNGISVDLNGRINRHLRCMRSWLSDVTTYADDYQASTTAGRTEVSNRSGGTAQWEIGGYLGNPRWPAQAGVSVTARSYTMTAAQRATAATALACHGITSTTSDGGATYTVTLDEPWSAIAVLLLDPASTAAVVSATRNA